MVLVLTPVWVTSLALLSLNSCLLWAVAMYFHLLLHIMILVVVFHGEKLSAVASHAASKGHVLVDCCGLDQPGGRLIPDDFWLLL